METKKDKLFLTQRQCEYLALQMYNHIRKQYISFPHTILVYGVPRGGIPVAYLLKIAGRDACQTVLVQDDPKQANLIVDDIVDSGKTKFRHIELYNAPFFALCDYLKPEERGRWVVFPWEVGSNDQSADDIVLRLLQFIGEDPDREGLKETPQRFLKAWKEWTSGYSVDAKSVFKVFEDGAESYDEMIWLKEAPFFSNCEHHLAPFFGSVTIAYIPDKRIAGISKLGRVTEVFARRLQVQERLTSQIADAIQEHLQPKGVGVLIKARHLCMESRGYSRQGQQMITSALRGKFLEDAKVRSEFLSIAQ